MGLQAPVAAPTPSNSVLRGTELVLSAYRVLNPAFQIRPLFLKIPCMGGQPAYGTRVTND